MATMTVAKLHKMLGELVESGQGRRRRLDSHQQGRQREDAQGIRYRVQGMSRIIAPRRELILPPHARQGGFLLNPFRFGGGELWTPEEISTALWLDASDSSTVIHTSNSVTQWSDKSGNGLNVVAGSSPTRVAASQNSLDTLSFDGGDYLNRTTASGLFQNQSAVSVYIVRKATSFSTNKIMIDVCRNGDTSTRAQFYVTSGQKDGAGGRTLDSDGGQFVTTTNNATSSGWDVMAYSLDYANTDLYLYRNGTQDGSSTSFNSAVATSNTTSHRLVVGASGSYTVPFVGEMAEIVVVHGDVSSGTRQKIEGYLAHKWGLAGNLPGGHPYKSSPPTI